MWECLNIATKMPWFNGSLKEGICTHVYLDMLRETHTNRHQLHLWGIRCTYPPPKTDMAIENPPFEDVFPVENGDFPMSC